MVCCCDWDIEVSAMVYDANEVAKLVINESIREGKPVTNLKLQKILYFMWIDWFAKKKEYLFDNRIEAWHYGPVIPDVYYRYRIFVADPIRKECKCSITGSDKDLIIEMADRYIPRSAGELISDSHACGSPWEKVGCGKIPCAEIPKELMVHEAR